MGAVHCAGEIPLLLWFFYLLDGVEANHKGHFLDLSCPSGEVIRVQTLSGWEFAWASTSVK